MQKKNYQKELDKKIEQIVSEKKVPRLFLHSCCAPCSSYVLEYLSNYFQITVFYYNPNITEQEEYEKRVEEQQRLIREMDTKYPVKFLEGAYEPERFLRLQKVWKRFRKAVCAAENALNFGWLKRQGSAKRADMIILPRPLPSVR